MANKSNHTVVFSSDGSDGNGSGKVILSIPGIPNYSNVTIAGNGTGLTYSTATGVGNWATSTQAKVRITEDDIEIKGTSLAKVLETLEERLAILVPNPELEEQFEQLAEIRHQYNKLETELKEKVKSWDILKKPDR